MITVNHDPVLWCSSCLKSWDKDAIAVRVAQITICDKCAQEAADVAQRERGRRRLIAYWNEGSSHEQDRVEEDTQQDHSS